MKPTLYLETTIPSYLAGRLSENLVTAAHQQITRRWWDDERHKYQLYVSTVVDDEIGQGNPELRQQRQALVAGVPRLAVTSEVSELAEQLHQALQMPPSAKPDAFHLALACHYRIDYLLTWNLKHLASGRVRLRLARFHDEHSIPVPTVCTPEELLDWSGE